VLIPSGHAEKSLLADENLFQCRQSIPHEVEPVSNLQRLGCSLAHAVRIGTGAVTTDHSDPRVVNEPLCERAGTPIRQKIDRVVPLQVSKDGSIGLATAETPVVDA
jgi:hypothetical protein